MRNAVTVVNTDINSHKQVQEVMYLKRHWAVNARRPLTATLAIPVMSAIAQGIARNVR
jgi:hypothetical protein